MRRQCARTNQNFNKMANLKELCSNIPQSMLHTATNYEVARRKVAAHRRQQREYNARMHALDMEQCIFEQCKRNRSKKRVHNTFSTEEAGRGGASCIHENRFRGSYIHVVSKSRIK